MKFSINSCHILTLVSHSFVHKNRKPLDKLKRLLFYDSKKKVQLARPELSKKIPSGTFLDDSTSEATARVLNPTQC